MKPIIVIVGPTGVGKTKLSVELAKKLEAEIINGDSMQVYKKLNIGTAKIKEDEKEGIPHHLFDIVDVNDNYTVYDYQRDCRKKIEEITKKGKRVIIVGGTGLYIKAALFDYEFKEELFQDTFEELTNEQLLEEIKKYEPNCLIHVNNRKRLVRTLNKYQNNGEVAINGNIPLYPLQIIGLTTNREVLYNLINKRVDKMVNEGLIDEVKSFYDKGTFSKAIETGIGYKEFYPYFDGKISLIETLDNVKKNSRHYAKRQYTFFNHQLKVTWFETNYNDFNKTVMEVEKIIEK